MRYLYLRCLFLFFFFLLLIRASLVFAIEVNPPAPDCPIITFGVCTFPGAYQFDQHRNACSAQSGKFAPHSTNSCTAPSITYFCKTGCSCLPSGSLLELTPDMQCACPTGLTFQVTEDHPLGKCLPAGCPAGQVMYENFCRDAADTPDNCSQDSVTILIDGKYVCTNNNPSCPTGHTQGGYNNPNGSWTTCSPPSGDGNSSEPSGGSNSSAPASSPATGSAANTSSGNGSGDNSSTGNGSGDNSSTGDGSGSGGGSGSGNGTGSGSGTGNNNSSAPSDSGSGSGDSGIGTGSAAAANCDGGEPECDGDPIQCALLIQLWINNCAGYDEVELNNPADDNEAIRDNFDALMSSAEPSVNAEGVLDAMTPGGGSGNGTGSGSGSGTGSGNGSGGGNGIDLSGLDGAAGSGAGGTCPADRQINLASGSYSVSYQFFCDFASQVSGLVLLIFSYIGAMIVYRSLQW